MLHPHQMFQWAQNRRYYADFMTKEIWDWYFDEILGREKGGRSIKVIVIAGPQTLLKICRALCNWDKQFQAGNVGPFKLVAAFCEDIFTQEGAAECDALDRIHGYYQPYANIQRRVWDPEAPLVRELHDEVEKGWKKLRKDYPQLDLPELSYLSPQDPAARRWVQRVAAERVSEGRRAFNMILTGPLRAWVPYWMRETALEVSVPDPEAGTTSTGQPKRKLVELKLFDGRAVELTYGMCWGFHPIGSTASRFGYCAHVGRNVLAQFMGQKLEYARGAMMGLGPKEMDDPRLLDVVGPLTKIGAEFPERRKRTKVEFHENCLDTAEWYAKQVPHLLFGKAPKYPAFAEAFVERIFVAYHAKELRL